MARPRVTVGMTLFNVERYLPAALESLLAQEYADFEIVACDNDSTDRTWRIVTEYASRDPRIRPYRNETNLGVAASFRRVVELARGEFFKLQSHDDLSVPEMLGRCVAALDGAGTGAVLAYPRTRLIGSEGEDLGSWKDVGDLRADWAWRRIGRWGRRWHLCNELFGVMRTDALRGTHLIVDSLVSPDILLLAELAMRGKFVQVPDELFFRRMHPAGTHQGDRTLAEVAQYLEPHARKGSASPKYALTREAIRLLPDADVPRTRAYSCTAAFTVNYGVRRVRDRLRPMAARLLRLRPAPAPWERSGASESG